MRIVFIIPVGIERPSGHRYFQIAKALVNRGHHVRILALHPDWINCHQPRFIHDGVEIWYVGQMHARKRGSNASRFGAWQLLHVLIASTLGLIVAILRSPADIYHAGKAQPLNGCAVLIGVYLLRWQPFYVDCDDDEVNSNRLTSSWQRAIFAFWQWLIVRLAAGSTVNTHFLAAQNRRRANHPVVYVPNGVDPSLFHPPSAAVLAGLRTALRLDGQQVIVYAGSLALQNHPVNLLIDAFVYLLPMLPNTSLLLVGSGEDLAHLQEYVQQQGVANQVRFTGHLPRSSVHTFFALGDVSVDPVQDDSVAQARSPLKLFESLCVGVPVVTADVGDRRLLLDEGRAGVLVAPGDPLALAQGILAVLGDPIFAKKLAEAGQRHVQAHYTWSQLATRWATLYEARAT